MLFFSLADSRLSVNQHSSELARADGWLTWSDPGNECSALPSLSPVSTFHIQYYTNAEHSPFPPHFPPAVSCNYPLTAFFFPFPHSTKCGPQHLTAGQKKSESACCLSFLSTLMYCQCRKEVTVRERDGKTREVVGAEGLHKHDEYKGSKHKPGCHNTLSV